MLKLLQHFSPLFSRFGKVRLQQMLHHLEDARFSIIFLCLLVGAMAGCTSVAMHKIGEYFAYLVEQLRQYCGDGAKYVVPVIPGLAIMACVLLSRVGFGRFGGYKCALTQAISAVRTQSLVLKFYHTFCHILTCGMSVGCGISAGMEAPSALTGAAIGSNVGRLMRFSQETRSLLMAAGSSAAIAAIFNSPMAGVLFSCEILLPSVSAVALIPLLMASATAAILAEILRGGTLMPELILHWDVNQIPYYAILGVLLGMLSVFVIRVNLWVHRLFKRLENAWLRGLLAAGILYVFFFAFPSLCGSGQNHIASLLRYEIYAVPLRTFGPLCQMNPVAGAICAIGLLSLLKPLVSSVSLEGGGDGGVFSPALFVGAFFGYFYGQMVSLSDAVALPVVNCVALGMAGVLAGVMHAPLTGLFLIAEILGNYDMLIPLMIVVALSSLVSKVIAKTNIYITFIGEDAPAESHEKSIEELNESPVREFLDTGYYPLLPSNTLNELLDVVVATKESVFPVLNDNGHLLGIVREEHIRPFILNNQLRYQFIVEDFMGVGCQTISPDATIQDAIKVFDSTHVWMLPVVDQASGRFLGFLNRAVIMDNYRQFMALF